jgi:hypothetical protein
MFFFCENEDYDFTFLPTKEYDSSILSLFQYCEIKIFATKVILFNQNVVHLEKERKWTLNQKK